MAQRTRRGEIVGLMLPSAAGAAVSFFALQAFGRVPAMLNFTAGSANLLSACETAEIRTVYTSRRFVEQAKLGEVAAALEGAVKLVYLEDLRGEIGGIAKLRGLLSAPFAGTVHARACGDRRPRSQRAGPGALHLGLRGQPKGVVLSHDNLLANCRQLAARIDFNPTDSVFNALPVFHSFGLTGGMLLPLFSGVKTFMYPSPLHYRIVPVLAYDTNATILFGTDTFLAGYARMAHPYDFYALRYVFAGAERVRDETRRVWMEKFGLRILEGYGVDRVCAGDRGELAHALPGRHRGSLLARRRAPRGACAGRGGGRPAHGCGSQRHAGLPEGRQSRHPGAAAGRLVRHRRHRRPRRRGLYPHLGAGPSASPRSPARWSRWVRWKTW
jgi:acyl-[acyl-carrier-protein]-phospholipid O-acyltransferase / long-chain-fatty-acid--[acyl-carrier-protein] ligase